MRPLKHGPSRSLRAIARAALIGAALAIPSGSVVAKPPQAFTWTSSVAEFEATAGVGSFDFEFVMVGTGPRWLVYEGPASTTGDPVFFDTQAGSCWQALEALGNRIPGKTTCTIQVRFNAAVAGTYTGKLVVFRCLQWHIDPTFGMILCDVTDDSQSVDLWEGQSRHPEAPEAVFRPRPSRSPADRGARRLWPPPSAMSHRAWPGCADVDAGGLVGDEQAGPDGVVG